MALLLMDGFETLPVMKPGTSMSNGGTGTATGRDGVGKALVGNQLDTELFVSIPSRQTIIAGFGYWMPSSRFGFTNDTYAIVHLQGDTGAITHLTLNTNATGNLLLRRGIASGSIIATSASAISGDAWNHIEIKATLSDTVGTCVVKVNGVEFINYSGDTRNGGSVEEFDRLMFGTSNIGNKVDDLYVLDTTGPAPLNDYLGDCGIKAVRPDGNGASSQWVGSDADSTDNYLLVDEVDPNTTDYVGSAVAGERDLYTMSDIASSGTVHAVQANIYAQKSDTGTRSIKPVYRSAAGTVLAGSEKGLSTSWTLVQGGIRTTDADAAAWTVTSLNGHQFGIETV